MTLHWHLQRGKMDFAKERNAQGVEENTTTCTCQQCNENLHIIDTKPTYNPSGEIVGRICNHCRIKNVEYARRCQILGCKAPDSKGSGFRTLPSKFYDLEEGDVKIRIVKQFGITESTRACCNMCYMRISKAIVQMKIVYGDGILKTDLRKKQARNMTGRLVGSANVRVLLKKEAPVRTTLESKESWNVNENGQQLSSKYTGPQFKRKYSAIPVLVKQALSKEGNEDRLEADVGNVASEKLEMDSKEGNLSVDVDNKLIYAGVSYDKIPYDGKMDPRARHPENEKTKVGLATGTVLPNTYVRPVDNATLGSFYEVPKSTNLCLSGVLSTGGMVIQGNGSDKERLSQPLSSDDVPHAQHYKKYTAGHQYTAVAISPSATRFCRILPKPSEVIQDKLATTIDHQVQLPWRGYSEKVTDLRNPDYSTNLDKPVSSENFGNGDSESERTSCETLPSSPGENQSEKDIKRTKRSKSDSDTEITSDIVSCMGCHKICSVREAKPVFDYEKGFRGRLCNDCRIRRREDNKKCPIKGCKTQFKDVVLKPLPPRARKLKGKIKQRFLSEFGLTSETKVCCRTCWKNINTTLKNVRLGQRGKQLKSINFDDDATSRKQDDAIKVANLDRKVIARNAAVRDHDNCSDFQGVTLCGGCYNVIRVSQIVTNVESNGRKCGSLCISCAGITAGEKEDTEPSFRQQNSCQETGVCRVKGCVASGHTVALVSCERILKSSGSEQTVRKVFDFEQENNACCRSCLARIKSYIYTCVDKENEKESARECIDTREKSLASSQEVTGLQGSSRESIQQESKFRDNQVCIRYDDHDRSASNTLPIVALDPGNVKEVAFLHQETSTELDVGNVANSSPCQKLLYQGDGGRQKQEDMASTTHPAFVPPGLNPVYPALTHPPFLQVGGQQFVLNVIRRAEQSTQTWSGTDGRETCDKAIQCFTPIELNANGQIGSVRRVTYQDAKEKTKYIIKKEGRQLFDQFMNQLDDISGGFGKQLLQDVYYAKETTMAANYEKILKSLGLQYHDTEKGNKTEKLRILSLVALYASNELLKKHFQRPTKKGERTSVTEGEIAQAREYAKQFGPGSHVVPEKVAELAKNKYLMSTGNENAAEFKDDPDSSMREASSSGPESFATCPSMLSSSTMEYTDGFHEFRNVVKPQSRNFAAFKADEPSKEPISDAKMTNGVEMVHVKILKNIAGVPVVDFGSNLPCNSQITSTNVPLIATFKYKPTSSLAPTQSRDSTQVVNADKVLPVTSHPSTESSSKERLQKKLKKKSVLIPSGFTNKSQEEKEKQKKSPNKLKFVKRSKLIIDGNDPKNKRMRTSFTREERDLLEEYFKHSMYVTKDLLKAIQGKMGLDKKKIDTWFRNRRSKAKKEEGGKSTGNQDDSGLGVEMKAVTSIEPILGFHSDNSTSMDLSIEGSVKSTTATQGGNTVRECENGQQKADADTGKEDWSPPSEPSDQADCDSLLASNVSDNLRNSTSKDASVTRSSKPEHTSSPDKTDCGPASSRVPKVVVLERVKKPQNHEGFRTSPRDTGKEGTESANYDSSRIDDDKLRSISKTTFSSSNDVTDTPFSRVTCPVTASVAKNDGRSQPSVTSCRDHLLGNPGSKYVDKPDFVCHKESSKHVNPVLTSVGSSPLAIKLKTLIMSSPKSISKISEANLESLTTSAYPQEMTRRSAEYEKCGEEKRVLKTGEIMQESPSSPRGNPFSPGRFTDLMSMRQNEVLKDVAEAEDGFSIADSPPNSPLFSTSCVESKAVATGNQRSDQDPLSRSERNETQPAESCLPQKKDSAETGKSFRGGKNTPRTPKKDSYDKVKTSKVGADSPRSSKRDSCDERGGSGSPRCSRRDGHDKGISLRMESNCSDATRRELFEISRRPSKEKSLSSKRLSVEEEEKLSPKRRRRSRLQAADHTELNDTLDEDEDDSIEVPPRISVVSVEKQMYGTRSRAR